MKNLITSLLILLFTNISLLNGQSTTINGTVIDKSGAIIGANIFLKGTYDGTVTDEAGNFSFETTKSGIRTLVIQYLGYESKEINEEVSDMTGLQIKIRASAQTLDAVSITASTFKAGDNSKLAVLKPLDMVTTAGSNGDVIAALQTLPGTSNNAEDGRLFVRGGDASETAIYIDGLRVFSPYIRTISGTPTRGRYSPFLFKGVSFSTGGYDTDKGQALSGVLDMETLDEPHQTKTDIGLMSLGLNLGQTIKGNKQSISVNASYIDLTPYYDLIKSRLNLDTPFRGFSGEAIHRYKIKDGMIKNYVAGDFQKVKLNQYNLDFNRDELIDIKNYNVYGNSNIKTTLNDRTSLRGGVSYGLNRDRLYIDDVRITRSLKGIHTALNFKTIINDFFIINYGADHLLQINNLEKEDALSIFLFENEYKSNISGLYGSADYFFSKNLAIKFGARVERSFSNNIELNPRVTLAKKLSSKSQISAAFGRYSQDIPANFLFDPNINTHNQYAYHYLFNYNYKSKKQILRLEGYYKDYDELVSFEGDQFNPVNVLNNGFGEAYGADLYWRANGVFKNTDFWISYGWVESNRQYLNFPEVATPNFVTNHNLSLVGKRFIAPWKSQLSVTYSFASGRHYENPNESGFMTNVSKPFQNLSASWAYLISQQKILFFSVSNIVGFRNEYGYRYASNPDITGIYPGEIIRPNEDQFFFIGFFMTISEDKKDNQLDNL